MSYILGRDKGPNKIVLPKPQVSSQHLLVVLNEDNTIAVEDLASSNGTMLNGKRIKRAVVSPNDSLYVADLPVSFSWLKEEILRLKKLQREDFTAEFGQLKMVYQNYKEDITEEKKKFGIKNALMRLAISLVPLFIGLALFPGSSTARSVLMYSSPALFGILSFYTPFSKDYERRIEEKREAFLIRYRCPKCGLPFGEQSWNILAEQKTCGRCQAIWIIKNH